MSGKLWPKTLLWQVEAAFTVEPLSHFTGAFPGHTAGWKSLTSLVPTCLFEHEPDVSSPQHGVHKAKNLEVEKGAAGVNGLCFNRVGLFVDGIPTTEVLRRDQRGCWVAVHLFSGARHAEMSRSTCVGFVAILTSERVLAQQELLTNHMKEKMTVMKKSCSGQKRRRKSQVG